MQPKGMSYSDSVEYVASVIVKASPGTVFNLKGYNSHNATLFIQIHDSVTLPANDAVPKIVFKVATVADFSYDFGEIGRYFEKGIVVCGSTTCPTKTIVGSAVLWINVQYT